MSSFQFYIYLLFLVIIALFNQVVASNKYKAVQIVDSKGCHNTHRETGDSIVDMGEYIGDDLVDAFYDIATDAFDRLVSDVVGDVAGEAVSSLTSMKGEGECNERTTYHANVKELNSILSIPGPYRIISFIGKARKGKSTTLNAIVSKLINKTVEPFQVGHDLDAETFGIWMYSVPKCIAKITTTECIVGDYSFIFLDIEGSDLHNNEIALRYAGIATIMSSKIFLFIHQTLYSHEVDQLNHIDTIRNMMNNEQDTEFNFGDIDLGILIREPLGKLTENELMKQININLRKFTNVRINDTSKILENDLPVLKIENLSDNNGHNYSIQQIISFLSNDSNYKRTDKTEIVDVGALSSDKIIKLLHLMIDELNDNKNLMRICVSCAFTIIIDWDEWGDWTKCDKKCDGGIQERTRKCNTGKISDCKKYHGEHIQQKSCNVFQCKDVLWSDWTDWSHCSKPCGFPSGTQERERKCKTGNDKHCEDKLGGKGFEKRNCNEFDCNKLKWGEWSDYSNCSKICGGKKKRTRKCSFPNINACKDYLGGQHIEIKSCNTLECKDNVQSYGLWNLIWWIALIGVIAFVIIIAASR